MSVQSGAIPYVGGQCQAVTPRSVGPVARVESAAQRSATRDWSDPSTPTTTTGDGEPSATTTHLFQRPCGQLCCGLRRMVRAESPEDDTLGQVEKARGLPPRPERR